MALIDRFRGWIAREVKNAVVSSANSASWAELFGVQTVTTVSADNALRHAAVYRCVALISGAIAMMPLRTYSVASNGVRTELMDDRRARALGLRPNSRYSRATLWQSAVVNMLLRGNGLVWIERERGGAVKALWHIPWSRSSVTLMDDGELWYRFVLDDMTVVVVNQADVLHLPGSTEWNGLMAKTPISAMGSAVGIGLSADQFAQNYFDNSGTSDGVMSYPGAFSDSAKQTDAIRAQYRAKFSGDKRFKGPLILDQGGTFEPAQITADDAQLLETRRFQIEDVARIFGVPRHLLALDDTSWGSGIDALGVMFVTYTLGPHLRAIEDEINWKIWGGRGLVSEFDRSALTKGDLKSRFEGYRIALGGASGPGFMTQNEIRLAEGLEPVAEGGSLVQWTNTAAPTPELQQKGKK